MSRHRGVRNRQYSYDDDDAGDYYDDEEEAAAWEEQQSRYGSSARASGGGGVGSSSARGISLSSYLNVPGNTQQQPQQRQRARQKEKPHATQGTQVTWSQGVDGRGKSNGTSTSAATDEEDDDELIEAIIGELKRRLGSDRFSLNQLRQAVVNSQYEVDTAETILLTSVDGEDEPQRPNKSESLTPSRQSDDQSFPESREAPHGVQTRSGDRTLESSPSSLAFGLCVDGRTDWRRSASPASIPPDTGDLFPGASVARPTVNTTAGGRVNMSSGMSSMPTLESKDGREVKPFGFDTPSPDDLNLQKQEGARTRGSIAGGRSANNTETDLGTPRNESREPRASDASPKSKVFHISGSAGSTPVSKVGRKSLSPSPAADTFSGEAGLSAGTSGSAGRPAVADVGGQPAAGRSISSPRLEAATEGRGATAQSAQGDGVQEADSTDSGGKERLALVVIGHVDAGKSTLMGQVLVQLGHVSQRVLHKQEREAREAGKASFYLAWVMDEEQEERAHGVTIDVAQKYVETPTKLVTLLDAPGHRDFIPNMISGASAADAAVLVVPATAGEFESGFQANGQTKEHAVLAKALGVNQLLVVVNKLDATDPPWSKERYEAVKAEVSPFLAKTGFRPKKLRFLPASGLTGENVSKRDPKGALAKWYDGPTLLEAIDSFSAALRAVDKPFRMCVSDVTPGGKGVSVTGRIVQGRVRAGDKLIVMPLEDQSSVVRLERNGEQVRGSCAGDNAELFLSGIDPSRVVTGNVLCKASEAPRVPVRRRFNAQIITLQALEVPIVKGTEFQLHMHNLDVIAHCSKLISLNNNAGEVSVLVEICHPKQ